ncbi:MAG: hypothetical protein IPM14_12930 [bacterium]|nr:hypothetical protein [bacterium]
MISDVVFHPGAEEEFNEAILWYGNQQKGLDIEFARCIDDAIQKIIRIRNSIQSNLIIIERKSLEDFLLR